MPKILPLNLMLEKNKTQGPNPWIILLEIDVFKLTAPLTTAKFRLCKNFEDVVYPVTAGNTYTAFPFELEPTQSGSKGRINTVDLKLSNVSRIIQQTLEAYDGGVDGTVKLTIVNNNLRDELYTELEYEFSILSVHANVKHVTLTMGTANPIMQIFPLYRQLAGHCRYVGNYKGAECRAFSALTTCDGTLSNCDTRNNLENYGGYPGIKAGGIQIAQP